MKNSLSHAPFLALILAAGFACIAHAAPLSAAAPETGTVSTAIERAVATQHAATPTPDQSAAINQAEKDKAACAQQVKTALASNKKLTKMQQAEDFKKCIDAKAAMPIPETTAPVSNKKAPQ